MTISLWMMIPTFAVTILYTFFSSFSFFYRIGKRGKRSQKDSFFTHAEMIIYWIIAGNTAVIGTTLQPMSSITEIVFIVWCAAFILSTGLILFKNTRQRNISASIAGEHNFCRKWSANINAKIDEEQTQVGTKHTQLPPYTNSIAFKKHCGVELYTLTCLNVSEQWMYIVHYHANGIDVAKSKMVTIDRPPSVILPIIHKHPQFVNEDLMQVFASISQIENGQNDDMIDHSALKQREAVLMTI